jgi:HEAT repeat protein
MNGVASIIESRAVLVVGMAMGLAVVMIVAVLIERIAVASHESWLRRVTNHYTPIVQLALAGDAGARGSLQRSPSGHRLTIARLILIPLMTDRDPARIADARELIEALELMPSADRLLRSPWWWRRAMGLRALGAMRAHDRTAAIIAALDDSNEDVRNTAVDALADLQDPASLPAIVVRLHDTSLHRGRRGALLAAFGPECEPLLLELAAVDSEHRVNYALALGICGTAAARPILCEWSRDSRAAVRAAAMEALSHIGVDDASVPFAIAALEDGDAAVRAMAASALHGCADRDTAATLGRHLDDTWAVALRAARSLQTMDTAGRAELEARAAGTGLAAMLARQMLWEARAAR